jgi:hypothetical protein
VGPGPRVPVNAALTTAWSTGALLAWCPPPPPFPYPVGVQPQQHVSAHMAGASGVTNARLRARATSCSAWPCGGSGGGSRRQVVRGTGWARGAGSGGGD